MQIIYVLKTLTSFAFSHFSILHFIHFSATRMKCEIFRIFISHFIHRPIRTFAFSHFAFYTCPEQNASRITFESCSYFEFYFEIYRNVSAFNYCTCTW